jgi:hypothetical protein
LNASCAASISSPESAVNSVLFVEWSTPIIHAGLRSQAAPRQAGEGEPEMRSTAAPAQLSGVTATAVADASRCGTREGAVS